MNDWTRRHLDRASHSPAWLQDLLLAIAVCEADLVIVLFGESDAGPFGVVPRGVGVGVVILISLPLVFRRTNPTLVMALTGFAAGAAGAVGIPNQALAPLVALYTVAAYSTMVDTVVSTGIFLAITTGLLVSVGHLPSLYSNTLLVVGVAVIGRIVQANRAQTLELESRAAQLERRRDAQARLAVTSERERIARDMHDILAHSTSVMVVQATGARRMLPERPEQVAEALKVIEDTGRMSLAELRRMLGLLREGTADADLTRPQPGLADISELVETFVAAGLPVELRQARRPLPDEVDASIALSTYRVVQDALTNAMKHARADRVTVDLCPLPDRLLLEVLDDGGHGAAPRQRRRRPDTTRPGSAPVIDDTGGGFGLIGMRERAALVGGVIEAGPRPGGG
ncbi:MAG TPA: histidine kinase, partial [Euzebya sp.]|nr:histidine kinase [Euzebya sp.]